MWIMEETCYNISSLLYLKIDSWPCFAWYQDLDHIWNESNFIVYLKEAERRWNRITEFDVCEVIGSPQEDPFLGDSTEGNWMVREPPGAIHCNKNRECALSSNGQYSIVDNESIFL